MPRVTKFNKCNLDNLMHKNKLKLNDLAVIFGVSYQQIQKYKTGANEMPLIILFKACKILNCTPEEIYPEIEMYYAGYNIPTNSTIPVTPELYDESSINKDIKVTYHNNYHYYGFSNIFSKFFTNMKILDTNPTGSLLIKIAYTILAIYIVGFTIVFGLNVQVDIITVLFTSLNAYSLCFGLIAPLIVRHPIMYLPVFAAFRILTARIYYLITAGTSYNTVTSTSGQLFTITSAIILTLMYVFFVNKYLRKTKK